MSINSKTKTNKWMLEPADYAVVLPCLATIRTMRVLDRRTVEPCILAVIAR